MNPTPHAQKNEPSIYWLVLLCLFLFSFLAGVLGFRNYFILNGIEHDFLKALYCTFQLYVLKSGDVDGIIPLGLQLARFIAPLASMLAIILTLFEIFREQWNNWMISRMKNHVVIIGFGSKGKNIMDEYLAKGKRVLIIEQDPDNPGLGFTHTRRSRLMIGDGTDVSTLSKANITKADFCYLLLGDDSAQVKACLEIYKMIIESGRDRAKMLNCVIHLNKQEFLSTVKENKMVKDQTDAFNLTIFNVYENSARHLFMEYPPDRKGLPSGSEFFIQMIIFGFGMVGEALALQTALTGHFANKSKPKVVVFDRMARVKIPDFQERYPTFTEYCNLDYENTEADSPQLIHKLVKYIREHGAITTMVLCFDNETHNLLMGLQLESLSIKSEKYPVQIFVRTKEESSFTSMPETVHPYGLSSKVCSHDVIFGENLDIMAKAFHREYLERRKKAPNFGEKIADVEWEELPLEYKDSNRKVTDHIGVKMRAIGCDIVEINDPYEHAVFSDWEVNLLAELEHRRWCAERSLSGWTYSEIDDKKMRTTPYLVEWNDSRLPDSIKEYDRDSVRNIPVVLKLIGKKVVRRKDYSR